MGIAANLPDQVLLEYVLEIDDGEVVFKDRETIKNCWRIKSTNSNYAIWEYQGNLGLLQELLEWRKLLAEKGFTDFLHFYKTKSEKNFVQVKQNGYYVTTWPAEGYAFFAPEKRSGLTKVVEALSRLRTAGKLLAKKKDTQTEYLERAEVYWLKAYQERLTELLIFYCYLQEKRLANDFERLYVENFEDFYERGQQAIQRMVLASSSSDNSGEEGFLIGNFLPENMLETETSIIFLNTAYGFKGLPIHDLSLFLKMYLPLQKWDEELALNLLTRYQEKSTLDNQEKNLFLAQLSFPGRFCIYTQKYLDGTGEVSELAADFQKYLYEIYWHDRCLEKLENRLWGE